MSDAAPELLTLEQAIDAHVRRALELTNGNKPAAAKLLGVHRSRIRRLVARATKGRP